MLVEAGDFASGTSSASTKLIHGGVRYLEQAVKDLDTHQYQVVRHALRERLNMLHNGPFLSRPIEFLVPCFSWFSALYFSIGLKLYDWLAGRAGLSRSRFVSKSNTAERMPALDPSHIVGSVVREVMTSSPARPVRRPARFCPESRSKSGSSRYAGHFAPGTQMPLRDPSSQRGHRSRRPLRAKPPPAPFSTPQTRARLPKQPMRRWSLSTTPLSLAVSAR